MASTARLRELRKQNRILVRQERIAERELSKGFGAMVEELASSYAPGQEDRLIQIVSNHQPNIAAILERRIGQTALIFGGRTLDRLDLAMGKAFAPELEHKGAREIFDATIRSWIKQRGLSAAVTVMGNAKELVRQSLQIGNREGLGEAGMVKLIRERIGKRLTGWQAARIARTEMHTASTIGSDAAARSTGLDMIKEWMAAEDARTRKSHSSADGQEVPLDEAFQVGASRLMVPGDPNGAAKEIINCRCAVLHHPVIGGEVIRSTGRATTPPKPANLPVKRKTPEQLDKEGRDHVLQKGRAEGIEHLTCYDAGTGKEFAPMSGGRSHCALSADMVAAAANSKARLVMHHNHPSSSSLSAPDLHILMRPGVEAIFAHGHDGSLYRAAKGSKTVTKAAIKREYVSAYQWLNALVQASVVTITEAQIINGHVAWMKLHRLERIKYEAELSPERKKAVEKHSALIEIYLED